jgi:thymidylate kinase
MFIVLESIDGGGKGRQRLELENYLRTKNVSVKSKEFPDHETSIWNEYLHPALHKEKFLTSGAWFCAFALEKFLWEEELKKYKEDKNNIFIADGYYTTTLVYQCILGGNPSLEFGVEFAEKMGLVKPDLTVYLDVNPKTALIRKNAEEGKQGVANQDIYESDLEKQNQIRAAFKRLVAEQTWCPWIELDGNGSIQEVRDLIFSEIRGLWDQK